MTEDINFVQYLKAKKTVDNQSFNRHVWDTLNHQLETKKSPLRVLEVGAGIGTMIARAIERELFDSEVFYTAVDIQHENSVEAPRFLAAWADAQGIRTTNPTPSSIQLDNKKVIIHAEFHTADAFSFVANEVEPASYDLLIAHAFIDLVHIPTALPILCSALTPGGLFYFPITFDGITAFEPTIDPELDAHIERLYHDDMEKRRWQGQLTGGSRAGRRLLNYILNSPYKLVAAGASDWVVIPGPDGYCDNESIFLHSIIDTVNTALTGHPELESKQFASWIKQRHQQVNDEKLIYIAHQLDVLGMR